MASTVRSAPKPRLEDYLLQTASRIPPGVTSPDCCPTLGFWRCGWKRKCELSKKQTGKKLEKCAVDFANNNFTREDVAKVIEARDGSINLRTLDELYQQLIFKKIRVQGYNGLVGELELVKEDCHKQGYSFGSVELDRQILNSSTDELIYEIAGRKIHNVRSWLGFKNGKFVFPLPLPKQEPREYHLRASGFTNTCHLARIIGKIDRDALQKDIIEEIMPNKYSVIGTTRHKLANQRPWVDYLRETSDRLPKIWDYCENEIFCEIKNTDRKKGEPDEIVLSGHGDASFVLTDGNPDRDIIINTDYKRGKRGAYEKPAYILRGIIYALGAANALGREFKKGIVVHLVKRFFHGEEGDRIFPKYYLGYASPENYDSVTLDEFDAAKKRIVQASGLENLAVSTYRMEKIILENKENFLAYKDLAQQQKFCFDADMPEEFRECFNSDLCRILAQLVLKGVDIEKRYFLPGVVI